MQYFRRLKFILLVSLVSLTTVSAGNESIVVVTRSTQSGFPQIIQNIGELFVSKFLIPPQINFSVESGPLGSRFDLDLNLIVLGSERVGCNLARKLFKNNSYQNAILAHEFGHAIFYENLLNKLNTEADDASDDFKKLVSNYKTQKSFNLNIQPQLNYLDRQYILTGNASYREQYNGLKRDALSVAYFNFQTTDFSLLNHAHSLTLPLSELFADIISFVWTGNPEILANALAGTDCSPNYYRSFDVISNIGEEWNTDTRWHVDYDHNLLAPVRWQAGKLILSNFSAAERLIILTPLLNRLLDQSVSLIKNNMPSLIYLSGIAKNRLPVPTKSLYQELSLRPSELINELLDSY